MRMLHNIANLLGLSRDARNLLMSKWHRLIGWKPSYFRPAVEWGLNKEKRDVKITVSLTSYPARIKTVDKTIETLLTQTVKPDRIVLWLGEDKFPGKENDLPKKLLKLRELGLTIGWVKDLRSYTKLIPALRVYPDDIIITVDDDIFYRPDLIEKLYAPFLSDPSCIYAQTVLRVECDKNGNFTPYNSWKYGHVPMAKSFLNHLEGVGGVLYPPHSMPSETLSESAFKTLAPTVDDVWFWCMAILGNVKICDVYGLGEPPYYRNPCTNDVAALWNINHSVATGNDKQLAAILERYPEIRARLQEENA